VVGQFRTAEGAGQLLAKLAPDIQKTAELVREISAASAEQSTGAAQVNKAIQELDQVIQQNATSAEAMAATAEQLSVQAEVLQSAIAFFKLEGIHQAAPPPPTRRASTQGRPQRSEGKVGGAHTLSPSLAQMGRALKSGGPRIELGPRSGSDVRDKEFAPYED